MPLIHRYAVSQEYAELLSTSPTPKTGNKRTPAAWQDVVSETGAWRDALFPSLVELQAVCRRMSTDPDLSQGNIFRLCMPMLIFIYLLSSCLVLRIPSVRKSVQIALQSPSEHTRNIVFILGVGGAGLVVVLATLRMFIWAVAPVIGIFVKKDLTQQTSSPDKSKFTQVDILGGIFM